MVLQFLYKTTRRKGAVPYIRVLYHNFCCFGFIDTFVCWNMYLPEPQEERTNI